MRFLVLILLLSLSSLNFYAQQLRIAGEVSSALTQEGVARAAVKLLSADSTTVLATDTTRYKLITERGDKWENTFPDKQSGAVFSLVAPEADGYVLVVEAKGFERYSCRVQPKAGASKVNVPAIYLVPAAQARQLGEAEVRGTRIKMFYKGDTLVYNADAFNVSQTESLRKLVEQFPGAEIHDGEIRIHGKRVDNLLLSGKDFFNGNIQAALDNLPAYIVSRVKVYDKAGELTELTGRNMHDESYVMDVHLKRKYVGMWMAKLAADGGTKERWGAQGFLMRFDERQMFTVNVDANNLNQNRQMSDMGNMADIFPWGEVESKTARMSYYIEPNNTWRFRADGTAYRRDREQQNWKNTETYLSTDNLMNRSADDFNGKEVKVSASTALRARKKGNWQHALSYNFDFEHRRDMRNARSISYYMPANPAWEDLSIDEIIRLEEGGNEPAQNSGKFLIPNSSLLIKDNSSLLNSLIDPQLTRSRSFTHRPAWQSSFVFGADLLNFNAELKHHTLTQRRFSNYRLTTCADGTTDARRRFIDRRDYAFDLTPELEWVHKYERIDRFDGVVKPFVRYTHRYGTANHPEYRLERMTEWSDRLGWGPASLGMLPQSEWRALCLDEANSYYSTEREDKAEGGIALTHKVLLAGGTSWQIDANEALGYRHRSLRYNRAGNDYRPSRSGLFFHPTLTLKWKHENREGRTWMPEWEAGYQGRSALPALTQLLPIRDDSDPLNLFTGNASLGNSFTHQVNSAYRLQHVKSGRTLVVNATYRRLHNDIATQQTFDAATGIRTYQPVNTNRTHAAQGRTEFSTAIDRKKIVYLSASLSADYYQAENLSFLDGSRSAAAGLLRNIGLTPGVSWRAAVGQKFSFHGYWSTSFRHVTQPGMSDNYRETALYGDFYYKLPLGFEFQTTLKTIFYAGNSLPSLNRTVTKWDARLAKYFLDDRLGVKFTASDLLNQASPYHSEVTATGRTETYTDVFPRYFLLSVSYRFNWVGKKK